MSKLLQKILSASVFPAALIIMSKIAGMVLVNKIFNLSWTIQTQAGSLFSIKVIYQDSAKALLCNSYSNFFVILVLCFCTAVVLFQGTYLHASHQNPRVLVKLMNFNFIMWLAESDIIFPRLAVWLGYLWIVSLIVIAQALKGDVYQWVAVLGFVSSIIATVLAFHDFERDLSAMLPQRGTLRE